ncbi:hypothetical protein [Methanobrevibacter arboriphilus]|nr:hypothetical protein [Methanobrevibacter arboriphilus]
MQSSSLPTIFDPELELFQDLIQNSEQGTYFNLKHFLFTLGVCL